MDNVTVTSEGADEDLTVRPGEYDCLIASGAAQGKTTISGRSRAAWDPAVAATASGTPGRSGARPGRGKPGRPSRNPPRAET